MTNKISRKTFLKLAAGAMAATAGLCAGRAPAQYRSSKSLPPPKVAVKTLIKGASVLTMEKGKPDLIGFDVLLEGGKIAAIGKSISAGGADIVDGTGKVLMPGFTDAFRHNWQTVSTGRTLLTDNSYSHFYDGYTFRAMHMMTPEDCHFSEYAGGLEAINSGYTNVVNFANAYFAPERLDAGAQGFLASGAAGIFCWLAEKERPLGATPAENGRLTIAARNAPLPDSVYQRGEALRDKYFSNSDGDVLFGFSNLMTLGQPVSQLVEHFKKMRAINPKLIIQHYNRPTELPPAGTAQTLEQLYEAGVFQPDFMFGHGLGITDDELVLMAKTGVSASAAPLVEMNYDGALTSIHGRAHKFGVPSGFAFDAPAISQVRDPFELARMGFQILFKTPESWKVADTLSSKDVLAWMTGVGAMATKRADVTGTLTVGKRADVILVDISHYGVPTNGTLSDKLVNFCSLRDIDSVWVGGKRRKKDGEMIGVDWGKLRAEREMRDARIWQGLGAPTWGIAET
jgi:cytosine/adenosine deaminase-related metal-dependent hydrolase